MDVFEISIPYLSMANRKTMLIDKVYAKTREQVDHFIKQHNLRVYDVNILRTDDFNRDFNELDTIETWLFRSNHDNGEYIIFTTENLIREAIDYIGEKMAEVSMFGDAIIRTDIPIIDIINRLIEKLNHSAILDYLLLDAPIDDSVYSHYKTFSNKALDVLPDSPSESDELYDYIYESLHNSSYMRCIKPEAITLEGYAEYIAYWLTDRIEGED